MTVRLVCLFLERALIQLFQTESANEVLRMEFLEHGRYATTRDGFVTAGTQRTSFRVVVGLAVRLTFMVKERATNEGLSAILEIKFRFISNYNIY